MNKALKLLEKNAEWIALGAAAAWIGWVGWGYFMNTPAKPLGAQPLGPTEIDEYISTTQVQNLKKIMDSATTVEFKTPAVMEIFPPIPPSKMPKNMPVSSFPSANPIKTVDMGDEKKDKNFIDIFPEVPAPTIALFTKGLSHVQITEPQNAPAAAAQPAVVAAAAGPVYKDVVWATVFGTVSDKAIQESYQKANIPDYLQERRYLRVEIERTEVINDRLAEKGVLVPQLPMNRPPFDPVKEWDNFKQWISPVGVSNDTIAQNLQPSFYTINKGDGWPIPPALSAVFTPPPGAGKIPTAASLLVGFTQQFTRLSPFSIDINGNYLIWQHDDSAPDGKTYAYRMRVVMLNPLYLNSRATQRVNSVLEIPGKWSDYSAHVVFPARMKWYIRSVSVPNGTIRIKAFKFDQGEMTQSNEIAAGVGDMVGGVESDKNVDFSTGWYLADIRQIGSSDRSVDTRITLMNAQGQTIVRWLKQEIASYNVDNPATRPAVDPTRPLPRN